MTNQNENQDILEQDFDSEEERVIKRRGKRQLLFSCAAVIAGAVVLDEIAVTMPAEYDAIFDIDAGRIEAIRLFVEKYNQEPAMVTDTPHYLYKKGMPPTKKRETITQTIAPSAGFTTERGKAVHRFKNMDWEVIVNFTELEDTVYVFYQRPLNVSQSEKTPQKPAAKFLPISALKDLQRGSLTT